MLVLTRKVDQGIVIAGNIYIRVLGVERDRVKIGIDAPTDIPILRQELLERQEKSSAEKDKAKGNGDGDGDGDVSTTPSVTTAKEKS